MNIAGINNAGYGAYASFGYTLPNSPVNGASTEDMSDAAIRAAKRSGKIECETCKNRQYQDGSNEGDVSFKAPGHISPQASAATVASHESEHVTNAYEKASKNNGQVLAATVSLKTAICPECGRSYVAGGQTNTMIKYNKDTPYGDAKKASDAANGAIGGNIDVAV